MSGNRPGQWWLALVLTVLVLSGCESMGAIGDIGASLGEATGTLDPDQAESVRRVGEAVGHSYEELTPREEHYIGRAVTAQLIARYGVRDQPQAHTYLNTLGQALAAVSDRPETYRGYRFLILDSEEINAFAAPGGFVMVTRGLLREVPDEDALAGVLAHEIEHVTEQHGLQAIRQSRLTQAVALLATESIRHMGSEELVELTQAFEGTVSDITEALVTRGYSRSAEADADRGAVRLMQRVGYRPVAFESMLMRLGEVADDGHGGLFRTHPHPHDRLASVHSEIREASGRASNRTREARFRRFQSLI